MPGQLTMAVPNKGRLKDPTVQLLADAGLAFEITDRALSVRVENADLDLLFVRTEDIPEMVSDGVADLGVTGQDLLAEFNAGPQSKSGAPEVIAELGYGYCRLAAAVPDDSPIEKTEQLSGQRVATAHPRVAAQYFIDREIDVTIVPLRGAVEVAPKLGVSEAIVDLVSTGSTLLVNGLRPIATVLPSQAVLIRSTESNGAVEHMATVLKAVVAGRSKRYVLLNAPVKAVAAIAAIIPGLEAPTVVPLAEEGMVAVHSVVDAVDLWSLLPRLEAAGGRGILVLNVEQLIP